MLLIKVLRKTCFTPLSFQIAIYIRPAKQLINSAYKTCCFWQARVVSDIQGCAAFFGIGPESPSQNGQSVCRYAKNTRGLYRVKQYRPRIGAISSANYFLLRKQHLSFLRKQESSFFAVDPCFGFPQGGVPRRGDIASFGLLQQGLITQPCINTLCYGHSNSSRNVSASRA